MSLHYACPTLTIEISDSVLEIFDKYRQRRMSSTEAGGQLFCTFDGGQIRIEEATEPGHTDKRGRFSFLPNRAHEQHDIEQFFIRGLHYIGDWHTHPEDLPQPSVEDIRKMQGIFAKSSHELKCMVLVVVGRAASYDGIWVGRVGEDEVTRATEMQN